MKSAPIYFHWFDIDCSFAGVVLSEMDAASLREERARDIHMDWERVFIPGTMKINIENSNVWLENVPNLCVECSETKVSEYLGETFKVWDEELSTRDA